MEQLIETLQKQSRTLQNIKVLLRMLQKALIAKDFGESAMLTQKINEHHQKIDSLEQLRIECMHNIALSQNMEQTDITLQTLKTHCGLDDADRIHEVQMHMRQNIQEIHILKSSICKFSSIMGNAILKTKQILTKNSGTLYEGDGTNAEEIESAMVYDNRR